LRSWGSRLPPSASSAGSAGSRPFAQRSPHPERAVAHRFHLTPALVRSGLPPTATTFSRLRCAPRSAPRRARVRRGPASGTHCVSSSRARCRRIRRSAGDPRTRDTVRTELGGRPRPSRGRATRPLRAFGRDPLLPRSGAGRFARAPSALCRVALAATDPYDFAGCATTRTAVNGVAASTRSALQARA
jgi:hypothetical protein